MSRLIGRLLVVLAFGWASSVTALPIVTVDGKDWLQPAEFLNLSWDDINANCNVTTGACTGSLGSVDVSGYTLATVDDVFALYNFFLPGDPMIPPTDPYSFQNEFPHGSFFPLLLNAGFLPTVDAYAVREVAGWTRTANQIGYYASAAGTFDLEIVGFDYANALGFQPTQDPGRGGWFFREAQPTPTPTVTALLALGLAVLAYTRRKRAAGVGLTASNLPTATTG